MVCTHGETIGRLRELWQGVPTIGAPPDGRTAKGAAWFVHGSTAVDRALQYLASDPPPPLARPA